MEPHHIRMRNDAAPGGSPPCPEAARLGQAGILSRRGFLAAAGFAGSATALTAVAGLGPARASTRMRRPERPAGLTPAALPGAGLVGATVSKALYPQAQDRLAAAGIFDGYVGVPSALAAQKWFFNEGVFPTDVSSDITALSAAGCRFLISFAPSRKLRAGDQKHLQEACEMYVSAGVDFDVILWQEPNDVSHGFFANGNAYIAYHEFYRPYVPAGVKVVYNACGFDQQYQKSYYPGDDQVDMVYCDLYAAGYKQGCRLDTIIGIADNASPPKPFGIGEFGLSATGKWPRPSHSVYREFITYLISTLTGRLNQGKTNGDVIYFDGVDTTTPWNTITSTTDWKVSGYQKVYNALSSAAGVRRDGGAA